ncbi:3-dehydrosphinganine reductase [Arthroderma sp. PD_2]|nr:3-dehydrosphinganine reductase [Arthroderma sp. PD_2]
MFGFSGKNQFQVEGQTVLITGGSEGMGRSVAIELSQKGANVVIASRTVSKLEAALKDIKAAALYPEKQRFHYVSADLKDHEGTERVLEEVSKWNGGQPPDIVWCCAGMSLPGFFVNTPPETLKSQMDTIYWTAAFTAHSTLSRWLSPIAPSSRSAKTTPRHIIFTSSAAVFVPIAGYGPYSPAKAAMRALADTLVQEIEMYNGSRRNLQQPAPAADVKIHIVYPMGILSPGFANEETIKPDLTRLLEEADKPQTPEEVARISIKGLERGDYMITTMFIASMMKAAAMGSSPRNNIIIDTLTSMVSAIAFLFVIPDLTGKVWNWGRTHGVPRA